MSQSAAVNLRRFRPSPDLRITTEQRGLVLVLEEQQFSCCIPYPYAAIWDLFDRGYELDRMVQVLQHIIGAELAVVEQLVHQSLQTWVSLKLVIEVPIDGYSAVSVGTKHNSSNDRLVQITALPLPATTPAIHTVDQSNSVPCSEACSRAADSMDRDEELSSPIWSVPYIDQPLSFWREIESELGKSITSVYLPLPNSPIGTGRPLQPRTYEIEFLRNSKLDKSVLLNLATFAEPVSKIAPAVIESLKKVAGDFGVNQAIVANLELARRIHEALPYFSLTASVLMEVVHPYQARLLNDVCTTLVPGSAITRNLSALRALRTAFQGRLRLLVNEACLPYCPFRAQHFREMAELDGDPKSLCLDLLVQQPWLRLTASWILPQHLTMFRGVYDELKLAGRVTLQDPKRWRNVVESYVKRRKLLPHEIGGGPASVLAPIDIPDDLYRYTLECGQQCHQCSRCADYYEQASKNMVSSN